MVSQSSHKDKVHSPSSLIHYFWDYMTFHTQTVLRVPRQCIDCWLNDGEGMRHVETCPNKVIVDPFIVDTILRPGCTLLAIMGKNYAVHKIETTYITYRNAARGDRATHRTFREVWTSGSRDMRTDRHTDRQAYSSQYFGLKVRTRHLFNDSMHSVTIDF